MTVQITIEGKEKLLAVGEYVLTRRAAVDQRVKAEMLNLGQRLVRTSKRDYLSGPRPSKLGVVTDRLRGSITTLVEESAPHEFQLRFGTNVPYGRIHELGLDRVSSKGKSFPTRKRPFLSTAWKDEFPGFRGRIKDLLIEVCGRFSEHG